MLAAANQRADLFWLAESGKGCGGKMAVPSLSPPTNTHTQINTQTHRHMNLLITPRYNDYIEDSNPFYDST